VTAGGGAGPQSLTATQAPFAAPLGDAVSDEVLQSQIGLPAIGVDPSLAAVVVLDHELDGIGLLGVFRHGREIWSSCPGASEFPSDMSERESPEEDLGGTGRTV
jgi:hypothetical protein